MYRAREREKIQRRLSNRPYGARQTCPEEVYGKACFSSRRFRTWGLGSG